MDDQREVHGHRVEPLVDQRGQGRSDPAPERTWTLERMAQDVIMLARALGLRRYAVLGHSYGAFVALQNGRLEVMYQSYASAEKDATSSPAIRQTLHSASFLYVEVDDLAAVQQALPDAKVEVQPHDTFYGAREIVLCDPRDTS